ncbi:helix-turn-helix domain-containing protein [Limosilactobacillus reuteri]|uniref:helix-turn-helix domain-containing protein n=1 Tax=Limosilactobacillus reuteri TaxID=1598 RepID=UPI00128C54A8|nr:helix-turn-helix transcriptional regulator [Limosilactobacillus reuteri]MQB65077.1 hypothetical protein [Limosilactobacillus reuteri]
MTDYLTKNDFLTHLRNLEDKYGKRLNDYDFNLDDLVQSDHEDYQAILEFRELVKDRRRVKINYRDLIELLNTELTLKQIAEKLNCSTPKLRRTIEANPKLRSKYEGLIDKRKEMSFDSLKLRHARQKEHIGKEILKLRMNMNLTQDEVADKINKILGTTTCSTGTVSNWERGVSMPSKKRLEVIAKLCNTTVKELMEGEY